MLMVRAPLRVSFGGGGTDLAAYYARFGGFVLSAAITRYCRVVASEPAECGIRIRSADYRTCAIFRSAGTPPVEEPLALPKAAIERFADCGVRERGIDLSLASDVPPGSGLGSSSAMAVGLTRALAGGSASSSLATRYQLGSDFQAGTPMMSVNAVAVRACCTACMVRAFAGATSAAK